MNKYIKPEINVIEFSAQDIIKTSGLTDGGNSGTPGTIVFPDPQPRNEGQNETNVLAFD